jgi:hypothetical protein
MLKLVLVSSLLTVFTTACGSAASGPPKGEDYTPVNTPERETSCTDQQAAAKTAREEMVGEQSPEMRERTAAAVYAQAECEHANFDNTDFAGETQDEVFEKIRVARELYFAARNLYTEVITYGSSAYVHAGALLGDLHLAYATKLRATEPPEELGNPAERGLFTEELSSLAADFDAKAALAYSDALALAESALTVDPNGADIQWTPRVCTALRALDTELSAQRLLCGR